MLPLYNCFSGFQNVLFLHKTQQPYLEHSFPQSLNHLINKGAKWIRWFNQHQDT